MNFAEKVKQLRTARGWTQEQLGQKLGKSKRTIVSYEKGDSYPRTREVYAKLAEILEVDINYLMTEEAAFLTDVGEEYGRRGQLQAEMILSQTRELFAGGTLSERDEIAFLTEMQKIFLDSKQTAREKFTPKKYRKETE